MLTAQELAERKTGLGGSDAAAALGLSRWMTPLQLYRDKLDIESPVVDGEHIEFGNEMEPVVANIFERRMREAGNDIKVVIDKRFHRAANHPFMVAHIDRAIEGEIIPGEGKAGLECKNASQFVADEWGESGTDHVPLYYLTQAVHYSIVLDVRVWYLAVAIGGNQMRWYRIEASDDIRDQIITGEAAFWDMVTNQTPPPPSNLEDIARLYEKADRGSPIVASPDILQCIEALRDVKVSAKQIAEKEKQLKMTIQGFMQNNTTLVHPDNHAMNLATWNPVTAKKVSTKALREQYPDVAEALQTESTYRRFLLK